MIAIPNMDKPKYCDGCDLVKFWVNGSFYCMADGEELNLEVDRRNDCPLIDIVTCGECKHRDPEDKKCDCGQMERQGCIFPVDEDYFCKYGERRSE